MDGTEGDHILFGGSNGISCITQTNCLEHEVCVKSVLSEDKSDIGVCQCSTGYKRNMAGNCIIGCLYSMYF